jgi:polyether ionophore transport system permease protein
MAADDRRGRSRGAGDAAHPIPLRSRVYGFGSVFGKAVRDSRRAFLIEVAFLAAFLFLMFAGFSSVYSTRAARDEIALVATQLGPAGGGLVGPIINVGTMGGYIAYRYGVVFGIVAGLWSILSLTATLGGEAQRGSLDIVAAAPMGRRRIAIEKVAAHVILLAVTVTAVTFAAWAGGAAFAKLPGDEVPLESAVGFALWIGLMALAFGSLAFVLSLFLGRGWAAWIAGLLLVAGPLLINERLVVPAFGVVYQLSPWWSTWGHAAALAGRYDWPSLLPVAILAVALLAVGIETFARRDIGPSSPISVRRLRLPSVAVGLGGPLGRSFGERLPLSLAWGLAVGIFGLFMTGAAHTMAADAARSPELLETVRRVFPTLDLTTVGGWLELSVKLLLVVAGLAAATLVAGWASDEASGRIEMVAATPLSRARWAAASGLGVLAAIALMTAIVALGIGAGALITGTDVLTPASGSVVLGLFAAAMAGIGFAIGGLVRGSMAAWPVMVVVVATYLVDLIVTVFHLPNDVRQIALTAHLGEPMTGSWDSAGVAACAALAFGGLAIGAWGFTRRDITP